MPFFYPFGFGRKDEPAPETPAPASPGEVRPIVWILVGAAGFWLVRSVL